MMKSATFFNIVFCITVAMTVIACTSSEAEAPVLTLDADTEQTYLAGTDEVRIHLRATDPQDLALEFEATHVPDAAKFYTYRDTAVFKWTPHVGDITDGGDPHRLVFSVTNEAGATTERTVRIEVTGREGSHFTNSSSILYDPSSQQPVSFEVAVSHDQAPQVVLAMPSQTAPEGASFEQIDDFRGQFQWNPSPGQRQQSAHTVVFEADDDQQIVEQTVTIVIQQTDSGGSSGPGGSEMVCEGAGGIDHEPVSAGRGSEDYRIEGALNDTSRNWEQAVAYWTTDDPLGADPDYQAQDLEVENNQFSGALPNPLLEGGESVEISYSICAFDDTTEDDGIVCGPEEFVYRFVAYAPDDDKCRDDGIDYGSPQQAGELSATYWEPYRVCEGAEKYHRLELEEGEVAELSASYSAGVEPTIDIDFDNEPVDVQELPCIGLSYATVQGPGVAEMRVAADDFAYHATAFVDDTSDSCIPEYDSADSARIVVDDYGYYDDETLCTWDDYDVYALSTLVGDTVEAYLGFDPAVGDLQMTLYSPSQVDDVDDGGPGVAAASPADGQAFMDYQAPSSGFYYLVVETSSEPADYELAVGRQCGIDDLFAGNHSRQQAATVDTDVYYEELKLCPSMSDWYQYTHSGDETIWVAGEFWLDDGNGSDAELSVYRQNGAEFDDSENLGEDMGSVKDFIVEVQPGETIEFEVAATASLTYDLEVITID